MKLTKSKLKQLIKEELAKIIDIEESLEEEKGKAANPWAICTDSVGREDKEKYERCVQQVKKTHKIKK